MKAPEAVVYTSAFRSSVCCMWSYGRICFADGRPDRYFCRRCERECEPVEGPER